MKIIKVAPHAGHKLHVTFDDGINGVIDLSSFIENGIFSELRNATFFDNVYTTGYSIAWSDELEIDAIAVYAELTNKSPEEILSPTLLHASN